MTDDTQPAPRKGSLATLTVGAQVAMLIGIQLLGLLILTVRCRCTTCDGAGEQKTDGALSVRLDSHDGRLHSLEKRVRLIESRMGIPLGNPPTGDAPAKDAPAGIERLPGTYPGQKYLDHGSEGNPAKYWPPFKSLTPGMPVPDDDYVPAGVEVSENVAKLMESAKRLAAEIEAQELAKATGAAP